MSYQVNAQNTASNISEQRQQQLLHLVKQDCGSCHGMTLKGGLGPALTKQALKDKPLLLLKNTIIHGRPGTAMPPWNKIINEQEALWISEQLMQGIKDEKK
nr:cytochrome c [Thalassotalea sp. G2M2-11]